MSDSDDEYHDSSDAEVVEPLLRENKRLRWTLAKYQKKNSLLKDALVEKDGQISRLEKKDGDRDELLAKQEDTIRNLIRQMNEQTTEIMAEKLKSSEEEIGPSADGEVASLKATIDIQSRRNNELSNELQTEKRKREKLERDIDMWRFNLGECEREIEQLKEQKEKLRLDSQRIKRDADVSKRLLNDIKLQLKNAKSEQENAQTKAEEQKKETVDMKSQMDKERRSISKLKEDHEKMKEKFDDYRKGYEDMKMKCDQTKKELEEKKEELRVKVHQFSRQNRHYKELERKYRELTEMHNRLKDRMEEKDQEMEAKENVLKEYKEKVWLKDKAMSDFKTNAEEAIERANELDKDLEIKEEDANTKDEQIANLKRLVDEMKDELARNNVEGIRRELESKEIMVDQLQAKLHGAKNDVEEKEHELEYLKKSCEDMELMTTSLEEKEYELTQLEALNSDLRTQISFKDDQITTLQKTADEQKVLLESQMYDLESYEKQVNEKNSLIDDLKEQIEGHCKTIEQKEREIKRHKKEKEDVKKDVEWKERKVVGIEEDVALQKKQLALMEKEIRMRENEVEERESSMLVEMTGLKELLAEKDGKIERLSSDLMEVKEYIEEEAKLVEAKDKEMDKVKEELMREKDLNKTNDPKSIREVAKKHHYAELMKEKRRHEQEVKKLRQKIVGLEEKLKEEQILMGQLQNQNEILTRKNKDEKKKCDKEVEELKEKLETHKKAWKDDKKKTDDVEMKFWSEEEKYVEEIRAIELARQKLKVENESLKEDLEMLDGVREELDKKTREVEELKEELKEVTELKKGEKEMMKKLLSEGEEVIHMYQNEVQQLKTKLMHEPAINPQDEVSENVEEMRRLIELEYNIGKKRKSFVGNNLSGNGFGGKPDKQIEEEYFNAIDEKNKNITKQEKCLINKQNHSHLWTSLILVLLIVPIMSSLFPYHVTMTSVLIYAFTLGFCVWKEGRKKSLKPGETNDALSKAISDIYDENQKLRKTVEQLIVRVASESVEKNELARKSRSVPTSREDECDTTKKELMKRCGESGKTIEGLQGIRKELKEEIKQLKANQRTHAGTLVQKDKVIKKLEQKLRDILEGEEGNISTEKILEEIREDDQRKELKKNEALERFQKLAMGVVGNTRREKILGGVVGVALFIGLIVMVICHHQVLLGSSFLAAFAITMTIVLALVVKSKNEVAKLAQELNEEVARSLETSQEIQELSTLVEKHLEVVTKQKRAISALERQLKVEHQRNENQKLIIAKLTWTIQEGKDIENLLGRSGNYRGQDKKALEHALKTMAENHVKEKIDLFQSMHAHFADDDVDNEEGRWIIEDLKQATKDITKALPNVSGNLCSMAEYKGIWKLGLVFIVCLVSFLWLFLAKYYGLSLLPLLVCAAFMIIKKTGTHFKISCDIATRCLIMDIIFVCISIATISLANSNGYLQETALLIIFIVGGFRVLMKKFGMIDTSRIAENKSQEIEELKERVREEMRRQGRMSEQMETWKQLLEVERSYNKESDDVISEIREHEQKTYREAQREIEKMKKERREGITNIEELEKELKKATMHCSKQRRQMEDLNKVIKDLEKRQKKGSREIDVLKELTKYEKDELHVALTEEKKAKDEIIKNVEKEKEKVKNEVSEKLKMEKKQLEEKVVELQKKLDEERKVAKDFLGQVDTELEKNDKINSEIETMKNQMEQEKQTREDLRSRFREINQIRQDREKVLLEQIDELQEEVGKQKEKIENLTQELEDKIDNPKKTKTKTLYEVQEKQISELKGRLEQATKAVEQLRKQEKVMTRDLQESRGREGKLLKDLSKLQEKSGQDHINLQKKQKEIKELKSNIEKMKKENEKLRQKLEATLLDESLGTSVVLGDKVEQEKKAFARKEDIQDEIGINERQDTSRSEDTIDNSFENDEVIENEDEEQDIEPIQKGVEADFTSPETQGILHWLGTSGGTSEWKNPGEAGIVTITRSSYGHGKSTDVADRKPSWCSTSNKANQWWKIDFGVKRAVLPTGYTLQHGWSGVSGSLRNWVLEGSRDGKVWFILMNHVNDDTLTKGYAAATWNINDVNTAYRFLRVRQTGKNSAGKDSLRLCGMEVYGQLVLDD